MGQNLSLAEPFADTSGVVLSPTDRQADIIVGITWACAAYGIGIIFCAVRLLERWSGEHGERGVSFAGVVAAFLCGSAWPLVLVYLMVTEKEVGTRRGVQGYGVGAVPPVGKV